MLAARYTREYLNGTHFEEEPTFDEAELGGEEPPEETDFILHDDDDDDDAEDPVSTGTAVAEAVVSFSTVAAQVERAERFSYLRCTYGKQPPKPWSRIIFTPMQDRKLLRTCQASLQPTRSWR